MCLARMSGRRQNRGSSLSCSAAGGGGHSYFTSWALSCRISVGSSFLGGRPKMVIKYQIKTFFFWQLLLECPFSGNGPIRRPSVPESLLLRCWYRNITTSSRGEYNLLFKRDTCRGGKKVSSITVSVCRNSPLKGASRSSDLNICNINEVIGQTQGDLRFTWLSKQAVLRGKHCEARKVAGSAECKQSEAAWNCAVSSEKMKRKTFADN